MLQSEHSRSKWHSWWAGGRGYFRRATGRALKGGNLAEVMLAGRAKVIHGPKRRSVQAEAGKHPDRENRKEPMWKKQLRTEGEHKVTDSTGLQRNFNSKVYVNNLRVAEQVPSKNRMVLNVCVPANPK